MLQISDGPQAGLQSGMQRPARQSNPGEQIGVQAAPAPLAAAGTAADAPLQATVPVM
jgi:hypothetical protein